MPCARHGLADFRLIAAASLLAAACVTAAVSPTTAIGQIAASDYSCSRFGKGVAPVPAPRQPGCWYATVVDTTVYQEYRQKQPPEPRPLTRVQEGEFLRRLEAIVDVFRQSAPLSPPLSFNIQPTIDVRYFRKGEPARGTVTLKHMWEPRVPHIISQTITVLVNPPVTATFPGLVESEPLGSDEEGGVHIVTRRQIGTVNGWPIHHFGDQGNSPGGKYGSKQVIVTRPGTQAWLPVSVERWVRIAIAKERRAIEIAENRPRGRALSAIERERDADMLRERRAELANLEARLAAMTPAERSAPAYFNVNGRDRSAAHLDSPNEPRARPIMMPNPALYDPAAAPTEIQLMVVAFGGLGTHQAEERWATLDTFREQLDWVALAKLLRP